MSDHEEKSEKAKFCAVKGSNTCACGNDYVEVCKPTSPPWFYVSYRQQQRKPNSQEIEWKDRPHEAHHILCVQAVNPEILGVPEIKPIAEETKWCINDKRNMIALPLWGHTIQHYCNYYLSVEVGNVGAAIAAVGANLSRPNFADLPQHNSDHNPKYMNEVRSELANLATQLEESTEKHKKKIKELRTELEKLSDGFRQKLKDRGQRQGGTHDAWQMGIDDRNSKWYEPFSMADNATPRTFPVSGLKGEMKDKLVALVKAFWETPA